jgi:hypothetical protein
MLAVFEDVRKRVRVTFDGKTVENLARVVIEITNPTIETIDRPSIMITFNEHTEILRSFILSLPEQGVSFKCETVDTSNVLGAWASYLKPLSGHKHRLLIVAICDGDLASIKFKGGTEHWSVKEFVPETEDRLSEKKTSASRHVFIGFLAIVVTLLFPNTISAYFTRFGYEVLCASLAFILALSMFRSSSISTALSNERARMKGITQATGRFKNRRKPKKPRKSRTVESEAQPEPPKSIEPPELGDEPNG